MIDFTNSKQFQDEPSAGAENDQITRELIVGISLSSHHGITLRDDQQLARSSIVMFDY